MKNLSFQLSVIILKEKNKFVAFAPALDLSTSGKTLEQAKKRFIEAAVLFFEECEKRGTLTGVLEDLGWEKVNKKWQPPMIISQTSEVVSLGVAA